MFLQETVALLVIVLGEAGLLKRILPLEDSMTQHQLDRAAERLTNSLAGLNYQQIESTHLGLDELEQCVLLNSLELMQETEKAELPEHHVEGLGRLLNQPELAAG